MIKLILALCLFAAVELASSEKMLKMLEEAGVESDSSQQDPDASSHRDNKKLQASSTDANTERQSVWIKSGMWTAMQKTAKNGFEIAEAISWLTNASRTTAQAAGGCGVRGSRGRRSKGPHHHQDFMISSLRRELPLLATTIRQIALTHRRRHPMFWKSSEMLSTSTATMPRGVITY